MPTKGTKPFAVVNVPVSQLAGFEVISVVRFWVIAEESLTSLFQHGGSADPSVLQTASSTLGKVGTGISN